MINLRIIRAVLATSLLLLFASPALADRLDEIKSRGNLIVGVSDTTPPFSFRKAAAISLAGQPWSLCLATARRAPTRSPSIIRPCLTTYKRAIE